MTQPNPTSNNTSGSLHSKQQLMPTNTTQSDSAISITPVVNKPKISFSSIVATGTQSSTPTSPTNGSTRIESQIISQRAYSQHQEQASNRDLSNGKPLKKFTSTATAAATGLHPPRHQPPQRTQSFPSEPLIRTDSRHVQGQNIDPLSASNIVPTVSAATQFSASPDTLTKDEQVPGKEWSYTGEQREASKHPSTSESAHPQQSTQEQPDQQQTRRQFATTHHQQAQYFGMSPPPFPPYMMGYPPMMAHGLYMPFPPGSAPFYDHMPSPTSVQPEGSGVSGGDIGHPPGITSAAPTKPPLVVPPPRRAIKIINPETRQEVVPEKLTTPSTLGKKPLVTLKTPSGQDVDIMPTRKDVSAVANLESQLAAMALNGDQPRRELVSPAKKEQGIAMEIDVEEGELESESLSSEEEPVTGNYLIQRSQSVEYPPGMTATFTPPSTEDEPWRYTRAFLLQFQSKCNARNQEVRKMMLDRFKQAAERHRDRAGRPSGRSGRKHATSQAPPQSHQPELQHRAENAWSPICDKSTTDAGTTEKIVRDVRGILNKLTLEKFDALSDKILSMNIMSSSETLKGVINCVFDKAVDEPHFCPMYAQLCVKIVHAEAQERRKAQLAKGLPAPEKPYSEFRSLLVTRCQTEYLNKRAWSKKRLEKLFEKTVRDGTTLEVDQSKKPEDIGHLTEEDLSLIKTKRHVLGNVHFIGELFKTGLLSNRVMHDCVQELLANIENPEEEEIESLCRLLKTVGKLIDTPDAVEAWKNYMGRMKQLIQPNSPLTSRVRFMIMDVLELREQGWHVSSKNAPKTLDELKREQERTAAESRDRDRRPPRDRANPPPSRHVSGGTHQGDFYRGSSEGYGRREDSSHSDQQRSTRPTHPDRIGDAHSWHTTQSGSQPRASTPPVRQFSTQAASSSAKEQSQGRDTWSHGPAVKKQILSRTTSTTSFASTSTSSLAVNRFNALEQETVDTSHEIAKAASTEASPVSAIDIKDRLRRLIAFADEYFKLSNIDDLLVECHSIPPSHHTEMLVKLIGHSTEMGRKEVFSLEPVLLALNVSPDAIQSAINEAFSMLDDLTVDIPAATEYAGFLLAVLAKVMGTVKYEQVLDRNLQERSVMTFLKTAVWLCSFLSPSIQRPQELVRTVLSIIDTTPSAIDTLKRSLKDSLYKALPELELRTFDTALNELQSRQASLSLDDFYSSLRHLLEPAVKLNPKHLPLILTRTSALVLDFMLSKKDTSQAPQFRSILESLIFIDQAVSVAILNALARKPPHDLPFYEEVFKAFYVHRLISMDAFLKWKDDNAVSDNAPIIETMSSWVDQLSEKDTESTNAGQL